MNFVENMNRAELEIAILENNLEDTYFNGLDAIIKMSDDEIRERLTEWIIEGDETAQI